jgi:hypothetical protein
MNLSDTSTALEVLGNPLKRLMLSAVAVILIAIGCRKVDRVSGIWEVEAPRKTAEAGITQWTIYRTEGLSRERVDDLVTRYRGYGDCIVYEKISSSDEYRAACGSSKPVVVLKGRGEWEFGNVGLTQDGRLVTRDLKVFREERLVSISALRVAVRQAATPGGAAIATVLIPIDPNGLLPGGETPLVRAVLTSDLIAATTLIQTGVDPNESDAGNRYPIVLAAAMGNADIIRILLDAGSRLDVTVSGKGPVTAAVDSSHLEVVSLLVRSGRATPADLLVARSHARDRPEILELLAEASDE